MSKRVTLQEWGHGHEKGYKGTQRGALVQERARA